MHVCIFTSRVFPTYNHIILHHILMEQLEKLMKKMSVTIMKHIMGPPTCNTFNDHTINFYRFIRGLALMAISMMIMVMGSIHHLVRADDHIVGANHGWQIPSQAGFSSSYYSNWASNQTFYLGDFICKQAQCLINPNSLFCFSLPNVSKV